MGLFNKLLKGLGFEDEEEAPAKPKVKEKKQKAKNTVIASYDLGKYSEEPQIPQTKEPEKEEIKELEKEEKHELDFELVKVKNQIDVQKVVQKIALGKKVLINTEGLPTQDLTRSLDFLSGAVYALNLNMQKVDDYLYLINKKNS